MIRCDKLIESAVGVELDNAIAAHGEHYNSSHEGYAVLMEEVQEAEEELQRVQVYRDALWDMIRSPFSADERARNMTEALGMAEIAAKHLAAEAAQIAAVCRKFKATVEHNG